MSRLPRLRWLVVAGAAALGLAGAALLYAGGEETQSARDALRYRGRAMTIETRIAPRLHAFGQPIAAEVVTVFDRALVRADSVRVGTRFDPYEQLGPEERTREDEGTLTRVSFRFRLQCLDRRCLPGEPKRLIQFEPVTVGYSLIDTVGIGAATARTSGTAPWPAVEVASRLDPNASRDVRWRAETRTLPEPSYRVSPALATAVLLGGAGALLGVAALVLAPLAPRRGRVEDDTAIDSELPPLERALLLLESRRNGEVPDRRRTLELVARELDAHGEHALAERARRLAWSKEAPSSESAGALAADVRAARGDVPEEAP